MKSRLTCYLMALVLSFGISFAETPSNNVTADPFLHIPVRAFVCSSNGVYAATAESIRSRIEYASQIFSQVGIVFDLVSISNDVGQASDWTMSEFDMSTNSNGQVRKVLSRQSRNLMNTYTCGDCLELYFVGKIINGRARAFSTELGIIISQSASKHIVAHEIGHRFELKDCYDVRVIMSNGVRTTVKIKGYDDPVTRESFAGNLDWGPETGRGFYDRSDTRSAIMRRLLMYGYDGQNGVDIPDGAVISLRKDAQAADDVFLAPAGASCIEAHLEGVFSK